MTTTTPDTILAALNQIGTEPSTKGKERLLATYMADENFAKVVKYMLDPYKMYGITDFDLENCLPSGSFDLDHIFIALDNLVTRQATGNHARRFMGSFVHDGFPAELMTRILNKDPKAGFRETLVNKVVKGFIPEFPYMRCALPESSNMKKFDWNKGVYSQLKADGMFVNVNLTCADTEKMDMEVQLMSRKGTLFPAKGFETLHEAIKCRLNINTQSHGELVVFKNGKPLPRQEGNGMINSVIQDGNWEEGCIVHLFLWDQIPIEEVKAKGKYKVPYASRFCALSAQVIPRTLPQLHIIETRIVGSLAEAYQHFKEKLTEGLEGTIVKCPQAIWADGTSKDQVKMKLEFCVDVRITGFTEGKGKFAKTFGAITYESEDGLLKGKTSGITDTDRNHINKHREDYLGTIMSVEANAVFEPSASNPFHTLSHPRVNEFRKDKTVADTLPQILDQMKATMAAADAVK